MDDNMDSPRNSSYDGVAGQYNYNGTTSVGRGNAGETPVDLSRWAGDTHSELPPRNDQFSMMKESREFDNTFNTYQTTASGSSGDGGESIKHIMNVGPQNDDGKLPIRKRQNNILSRGFYSPEGVEHDHRQSSQEGVEHDHRPPEFSGENSPNTYGENNQGIRPHPHSEGDAEAEKDRMASGLKFQALESPKSPEGDASSSDDDDDDDDDEPDQQDSSNAQEEDTESGAVMDQNETSDGEPEFVQKSPYQKETESSKEMEEESSDRRRSEESISQETSESASPVPNVMRDDNEEDDLEESLGSPSAGGVGSRQHSGYTDSTQQRCNENDQQQSSSEGQGNDDSFDDNHDHVDVTGEKQPSSPSSPLASQSSCPDTTEKREDINSEEMQAEVSNSTETDKTSAEHDPQSRSSPDHPTTSMPKPASPGPDNSDESSQDSAASSQPSVHNSALTGEQNSLKPENNKAHPADGENASDGTCKILTKYIFISKPQKNKSKKKGFGVLYRQAFKHFCGRKGKIQKKKRMRIEGKYEKPGPSSSKNDADASGEFQKKSKAKVKVAKLKKRKETMKKKSKAEAKNSESKDGDKLKSKPRKNLSLAQKVAIIKAIDDTSNSAAAIGEKYGISRTNIWRIMKRKKEILEQAEGGGSPEKKKRKKKQREQIQIKQEVIDDDMRQAEGMMWMTGDSTDQDVECLGQEDLPIGSIGKFRNRKDLTLEEKVQVIQDLEAPGSRIVTIAKKFGVSVSAISRINKNKELILLQSASGDMNANQKRSRECKDPMLDRVLLRWYRALELLQPDGTPISVSNMLLKEKAHSLAFAMGKDFFPSDNWIVRWKNRHNIGGNKNNSMVMAIHDREEFKKIDEQVNIREILEEIGRHEIRLDQVKRETFVKPEEFIICEHCGLLISSKKKKDNHHQPGCPASAVRKDLTLEEKVQVVRALEEPGMKMITLAKQYGVSPSAISRIHKNRVDILARRYSGLANAKRRRDRVSKEPEVERVLCEWFKIQHELGIHISGSMIREKAREIARLMGKDFWPSESWVFRWRHRNNVMNMNTFVYEDSEEELDGLEGFNYNQEEIAALNTSEDAPAEADSSNKKGTFKIKLKGKADGEKRLRLPRSVMCEKCGFVSSRVKNNRIKSLRHAKGCPDMKPRNELTYEDRAKMLRALEEPGATLSSVARQFGVSVSSMSRMNQKKDQIISHGQDHGAQKRIRDCKEPEVAYNLYRWYLEKKAEGVHVTGPKLKEKAKKFAAEMGREFNASSGWLGRWRHRFNIISSAKTGDKPPRDPSKPRKKSSKKAAAMMRVDPSGENVSQLPPIPHDLHHQDSIGSSSSVPIEPLDPGPPSQAPPVFIHQRFQNPWDLAHQQASSCVWPKEFLNTPGPSAAEEPSVPVSYAYGDSVQKSMFHNMFDSFSAVGYQVAMPVDSMVGRDYLKSDSNDDAPHPSHIQPAHHRSAQPHLQHHIPTSHSHSHSHPHSNPNPHPHQRPLHPPTELPHPLPSPSPATSMEDLDQQRQIMEAFKIMSSFAQKKSLGDQVQAALRTIEMSMKNPPRKSSSSSSRNTYTSI